MKPQFLLIFFCLAAHTAYTMEENIPPMKRCVSAPTEASKTPEEQKVLDALAGRWRKNYPLSSPTCHSPSSFPSGLRKSPGIPFISRLLNHS